jgi:hypothetical protein
MVPRENITLCMLPQLRIVQFTFMLLQPPMLNAQIVWFQIRHWYGTHRSNLLISHDLSMFAPSIGRKPILMYCTHLVITQFTTGSGNSHSGMLIGSGSRMKYINRSWDWLRNYCADSWIINNLEMLIINFTVNVHLYHTMQASSASQKYSIYWNVTASRHKSSRA